MNLPAYDTEDNLCTCGDNYNHTKDLKDILHCAASKHCGNPNYHAAQLQTTHCVSHKVGDVATAVAGGGTDVHAGTDTMFTPTTKIPTNVVTPKVHVKQMHLYLMNDTIAFLILLGIYIEICFDILTLFVTIFLTYDPVRLFDIARTESVNDPKIFGTVLHLKVRTSIQNTMVTFI